MRYRQMRFAAALILLALGASGKAAPREEPRIVEKVTPLPVAFDKDFEFRKTKLFLLSEKAPTAGQRARQTTSTLGSKLTSPSQKTATLQDAPITFERQFRMFGAVTALDQRQRFGNYFDDGRVIAWRCLLIANGQIVAENRSYMWE